MKNKFEKISALCTAAALTASLLSVSAAAAEGEVHKIVLSSLQGADGTYTHEATVDGKAVAESDYTWHCDPSVTHDEVKNAPAEYYTGTEPEKADVTLAHDIFYFPSLPAEDFVKVSYDGEQEWAYYYPTEENKDFIFATLPVVKGSTVPPADMMHRKEEAYENAVLQINTPGTYEISGTWHGQIRIDLGDTDKTFMDESAKVHIILNGVSVTCDVAPAFVAYSAYECDNDWESAETHTNAVDTSDAGVTVILADGSENTFTGTNVFRMLKTKLKDGQEGKSVPVQKKQRKTDAAFYSYVSMNIEGGEKGDGILTVHSGFEGLDSELHLTVNGGDIRILSQDDGINVNEDGVSVVTVNGGSVHILAGLGSEGDGIDSNGYLVINGGTVVSVANPASDSGLDSDCGSVVRGGTVIALGSAMDWADSDNTSSAAQPILNLQFSSSQSSDEALIVTDTDGRVLFAFDPDKDEIAGSLARSYRGAVLSSPNLKVGETYHIFVGGDVTGEEIAGVYADPSKITGFSAESAQQGYTGTFEDRGGRPGGVRPDGDGQRPDLGGEHPDFKGERPDFKGERPQIPEGMNEPPEGMGEPPAGMGEPPEGWGDFGMGENIDAGEWTADFKAADTVNRFAGVRDLVSSEMPALDSNAWWYRAVSYCLSESKISSESPFDPERAVSRAEAEKALGLAASGSEESFTRGDMLALLRRAAEQTGTDVSRAMVGDEKGDLMESKVLTRAELCQILYNIRPVSADTVGI